MEEVEREFELYASLIFAHNDQMERKCEAFQSKLTAIVNGTPIKSSKRPKHLSSIRDEEASIRAVDVSEVAPLRPTRTARLKAGQLLKEPSLHSKMRRPSKVKEERSSEESKENQAPNNDEEGAVGGAPAPIPKRKTDEDKTIDSISSDMSKKLSVEVIPVEPVKIEILSDDEKMPPPMAPPKKAGRPKKAAKEAERTTRSKLKEELPTEQNTTRTTRTKSRKKAEQTTNESSTTMRSEQSTNESSAAIRAVVKLEKLSLEDVIAATTTPPSGTRPPSGTSEASVYEDAVVSQKTSDATFLKPPGNLSKQNTPNATFAVPGNATFQVESPNEMNGTYTLPQQGKTPSGHDSIMTEDRSDEEPEPPAPKTKPAKLKTVMSEPVYKNGKLVTKTQELFNPVLQSPVKSRVQAFEKMTTPSFTSPMIGKLRSKPSNATPHDQRKPSTSKHTTPSYYQQASAVPLLLSKAASTSKLAHVQKHTSTQKANSLSRENSVGRTEDLKKATAEEKKRKRDERQRMAQQQREQMEKEKRSKAAALLKEKEERAKKHKQQMEEQAKMQRLQEQKREEMVRLEQQRRLEQQQLEAMRSKHNDSLQRQALHTQMSKNREATHEFAILETDDSTDDEGKMNRRRPQAPEWSKGAVKRQQLKIQALVALPVIDRFFSVKPTTIDLKEIFPNIDQRKLKRNSSAVWRTPPRYSTFKD